MKKSFLLGVLSILIYSESVFSQNIPVYNFKELEPILHKSNDTVYLVNFWATWCMPCVKELPAIEKVAAAYKNSKFKVLLVSLDMPSQMESRLKPFIKEHHINSDVVLLDDPDFNSWIDQVNESWSGAIPASLIYSNNFREFYEQSFEYDELEQIINQKIK